MNLPQSSILNQYLDLKTSYAMEHVFRIVPKVQRCFHWLLENVYTHFTVT